MKEEMKAPAAATAQGSYEQANGKRLQTNYTTGKNNLDLALHLAEDLGWCVFPCKGADKSPHWAQDLEHGKDNATINPEQIRIWWRRWPDALIGVNCARSGFFALDIDNKNDKNGTLAWTSLVETFGHGQDVLAGPIQKTPNSGFHVLFALPEDMKIPNNSNKLGDGLDLRCNGYICTGSGYEWLAEHSPDTKLTYAPGWLLELIGNLTERKPSQVSSLSIIRATGHDPGEYWLDYYLKLSTPGNRNDCGFALACQLRDSGLPESEVISILETYAARVPGDDYSKSEAIASARSACRYPRREAAHLPSLHAANRQDGNDYHSEHYQELGEPPESEFPIDQWQAFTLADAYEPRSAVEYIAANLLALPSLNILYGSPGSLKSFLLADLAICVAAGLEWLPPAPWIKDNHALAIQTRQVPTMWIDFDNGQRRTHDRLAALARARDLPSDIPLIYFSMPSPWLNAFDPKSISALSLRILRFGVKFVVIDNLRVVCGDADENSDDMARVMSFFRQVTEETGAAICPIHHQRKNNGTSGRAGDALRGHSSIEASIDLALMIERKELADTVTIRATKVRGADVLPFSAVFRYENKAAGELQTAMFYGVMTEVNNSDLAIENEIFTALDSAKMNKTGLRKTVKGQLPMVGINRIGDKIDHLAAQKKIKVTSGKNNTEQIYSKP